MTKYMNEAEILMNSFVGLSYEGDTVDAENLNMILSETGLDVAEINVTELVQEVLAVRDDELTDVQKEISEQFESLQTVEKEIARTERTYFGNRYEDDQEDMIADLTYEKGQIESRLKELRGKEEIYLTIINESRLYELLRDIVFVAKFGEEYNPYGTADDYFWEDDLDWV